MVGISSNLMTLGVSLAYYFLDEGRKKKTCTEFVTNLVKMAKSFWCNFSVNV